MRVHRKAGYVLFFLGVLLALSICIRINGEAPPDGMEPSEGVVSIEASFRQEDGEVLGESTVRVSMEANSVDYRLDGSGALAVSGLPRSGTLALTILDGQERVRGATNLTFSEGAVIDASTDSGGDGHITLKRDTREIALVFLLQEDGTILCALRLEQA